MTIRRPIIAMFFALAAIVGGCAKHSDDNPPAHSSMTFGMDGSHQLPPAGKPTSSTTLTLPAPDVPTTAPLALITSDTENFVIAQGRIITIGSQKFSRVLTRSTDSTSICELLCDSAAVYALHLDGAIERYGLDGKLAWHANANAMPHLGTVLSAGVLVAMTDSQVVAFSAKDGSAKWAYHSALIPSSLCVERTTGILFAALTANRADATDSIVCFRLDGNVISRTGFANTRITSNLSICEGKGVAFGAISSASDRPDTHITHVSLWSDLTKSPTRLWDHQLPYIVGSVANDGATILTGGFRETAGDMMSGVDAFNVADSSTLWSRRFDFPTVAPVCMSRGFAYMPFTFTTNATVPTKSILVTLDLSDGKSVGEFGVPNASTGFVQGVASPIVGMLAYADRSAPKVYFLKP